MYNYELLSESMEHLKPLKDAMGAWNSKHYDHGSAGDYSATTLINPPRIAQLQKRHRAGLSLPLSSQFSAFFGTAMHDLYEKSLTGKPEYLLEQRVSDVISDRKITGQFDILLDGRHLFDLKTTKAWKKVFDPDLEEWHQQQNIYAALLRRNGFEIDSLNLIVHYVDWTRNMAMRDKKYPQESAVGYRLEMWNEQAAEDYLRERIEIHKAYEETPDDDLPPCTRKERWERDTVYALMKNKSVKRATKLYQSLNDAINDGLTRKGHGADSFVEVRYARRTRCDDWCDCNKFCNVYQDYMSRLQNDNLNEYYPLIP
jgi:hypothetical protein